MFTYADLHPDRLSFKELFDEYFHYLPEYQDVDLADIQLQRVLHGFFPSYQRSPQNTIPVALGLRAAKIFGCAMF
jgi:lycopene cyclase CruP